MKRTKLANRRQTQTLPFIVTFFSLIGAGNLVLGVISGTRWDEAWAMVTTPTGQTVAAIYSLVIALLLRQLEVSR